MSEMPQENVFHCMTKEIRTRARRISFLRGDGSEAIIPQGSSDEEGTQENSSVPRERSTSLNLRPVSVNLPPIGARLSDLYPNAVEDKRESVHLLTLKIARALYPYKPQETSNHHIAFESGDVLLILEKREGNGWCLGQKGNLIGWFPTTYVDELSEGNAAHFMNLAEMMLSNGHRNEPMTRIPLLAEQSDTDEGTLQPTQRFSSHKIEPTQAQVSPLDINSSDSSEFEGVVTPEKASPASNAWLSQSTGDKEPNNTSDCKKSPKDHVNLEIECSEGSAPENNDNQHSGQHAVLMNKSERPSSTKSSTPFDIKYSLTSRRPQDSTRRYKRSRLTEKVDVHTELSSKAKTTKSKLLKHANHQSWKDVCVKTVADVMALLNSGLDNRLSDPTEIAPTVSHLIREKTKWNNNGLESLLKSNQELQKELADTKKMYRSILSRSKSYDSKVAAMKNENQQVRSDLEKATGEHKMLRVTVDSLRTELSWKAAMIRRLSEDLEKKKEEAEQSYKRVVQLEERVRFIEKMNSDLRSPERKSKSREETFAEEIDEIVHLRENLAVKENEIAQLKEEKRMIMEKTKRAFQARTETDAMIDELLRRNNLLAEATKGISTMKDACTQSITEVSFSSEPIVMHDDGIHVKTVSESLSFVGKATQNILSSFSNEHGFGPSIVGVSKSPMSYEDILERRREQMTRSCNSGSFHSSDDSSTDEEEESNIVDRDRSVRHANSASEDPCEKRSCGVRDHDTPDKKSSGRQKRKPPPPPARSDEMKEKIFQQASNGMWEPSDSETERETIDDCTDAGVK